MNKKVLIDSFRERNFGYYGLISVIVLALLIGLLSFKSRNDQWRVWTLNSDITFFKGSPLLSTADGPYFTDIAKSIHNKKSTSSNWEKRFFPEYDKELNKESSQKESIFSISLLPVTLEFFSRYFNNDYLLTANLLIPFTAFITAVLITIFFMVLGFGFEGILAGFGASLSQSIYVRTSIGRLDTDLLNIGFFYSILSLIAASILTKNSLLKILFISLGGFANFLFIWWYQQPGFYIPFLLTLIVLQFLYKIKIRVALFQVFLFSLFSGPFYIAKSFQNFTIFFKHYLSFFSNFTSSTNNISESILKNNENSLIFPDTFQTITELQRLSLGEYFSFIFGNGNEWVGFISIFGLIIFIILNFRVSFTMITALIFLFMSIFVGKRFAIYAIPLYWFGFSYIFISLILYISNNFKIFDHSYKKDQIIQTSITSFLTLIFIIFISINSISFCENKSFFNCKPKYTPMPSFSAEITSAFDSLKSKEFDQSSVVVTWWDYGYWLNFFSGLRSVHDGGSQRTPKTYLVANALTATSQKKSFDTINYLVSSDLNMVISDSQKGYSDFSQKISESKSIERPVYLFLSKDMIRWWPTITHLGNWDIVKGVESKKNIFERIDCKPRSQNTMLCGNAILNVDNGSISNGKKLDKLLIGQNGNLVRRYDYRNDAGEVSLLIDIQGENRFFYIVTPETLESTFTQLFFFNLTKNKMFRLIKDKYPIYRIYEVNSWID